MRINPINNTITNYQIKTNYQKSHANQNNNITDLGLLNKNYNQINFKGIPAKDSLEMVLKIPLEDRLASMFEKVEPGDLILVGKELSEAKNKMLKSIDNIDNIISRVFFLPEHKYRGYLGFFTDKDWNKEIINLNDFELKLMDSKTIKTDYLTPYDTYYIFDDDLIALPGAKEPVQIKAAPKCDLNGFRKNFCKAVDFTKMEKSEIEKINKKMLSQLTRETKEVSSKVTFKDVGGQDELIKELKRSILYPLKYPDMYESFDVNRGFILYGPPGTGKTHIARNR